MMECSKTTGILSALVLGVTLSLGIFGAGYCVGKALFLARSLNRVVTVKGLAGRDVKADLGVWEIDYREIGGTLMDLNKRVQQDQAVVTTFLKQHDFTDQELEVQPIRLEDKAANAYQSGTAVAADQRYVMTAGIRVRSSRVELIQQVNQLAGSLVQQGVALSFDSSGVSPNPSYYFTRLDEIRPAMLADATHSARLVAEQFAKDAGTDLNGIQRASQGVFQVMSRDSSMSADGSGSESALSTIDKKIRLVTTLDYRLK
jgi:hypothetical protein